MNNQPLEEEKGHSPEMFNRIAGTYDMLNAILSFGIDKRWRKKLIAAMPSNSADILDVATGTGDVAIALHAALPNAHIIGLDPASKMLVQAKKKAPEIAFVEGNALQLPFEDNSFDAVTISFGIRNVPETVAALEEMRRVLRPNSKLLVLEFSMPRFWIVRAPYLFYMTRLLPVIGMLISQDKRAYTYLPETIQTFPHGSAFEQLLKDAGYSNVRSQRLTFGVATLYTAVK